MRKAIDLILVLVILAGAWPAWQADRQRRRLETDYQRLARKVGILPIGDSTQIHMRALPSPEPLHFVWRLYLPPNYKFRMRFSDGSHGLWTTNASEALYHIRLRENEPGQIQVFTSFSGGSSLMSLGDPHLARFLRGRWDRIKVEQLGAIEPVAIAPDRSAVLIRLSLPDDLLEQARKTLPPQTVQRFVPDLFKIEIGPETPAATPGRPGG